MAVAEDARPPFLDKVVGFPDGVSYELREPLTDFKKCHDGTPEEGRILFICRRITPDLDKEGNDEKEEEKVEEFVIKIKVQMPKTDHAVAQEPEHETEIKIKTKIEPGPSTTTSAELQALEIFSSSRGERDEQGGNAYTPHLVRWKQSVQDSRGPLPGGYVTYTVMTKRPGRTLLDLQYWSIPAVEREEIVREFLIGLRSIYRLGVQPIDCALRNVMWERETKTCTIIDFELWRPTENKGGEEIADEKKELQRWGLARRPAPQSWWDEWNLHGRG